MGRRTNPRYPKHQLFLLAAFTLIVCTALTVHAQSVNIWYDFQDGIDGGQPTDSLVMDSQGNLYGTAEVGGANGYGVVFQVTPSGTETTLYAFSGATDGGYPYGGLVMDSQGNLYGTTLYGGSTACGATGCGVVFKVTPTGTESVLYYFEGGTDGFYPRGTLVRDSQGNLYGTTQFGGATGGYGTVYKISPTGTETILYRFAGPPNDGAAPFAGVVRDAQGNLYGTTESGGLYGVGTVFALTSSGEKILHTFSGNADAFPWGGLIRDAQGNLYGTATGNFGEVFKISPSGVETILYTFTGNAGGADPLGNLVLDTKGNLYGTTSAGGTSSNGTIFMINSKGKKSVIYNFPGGNGGSQPYAGLIGDTKGNGYGTTSQGGTFSHGTVFQITP